MVEFPACCNPVLEKYRVVRERISIWNQNRTHLPHLYSHRKFKKAATVITRVGFFAKAVLYSSMGVISLIAAVGQRRHPEGPQSVIVNLRTTFGEVVVLVFVIGIFCYSAFAIFYSVFDLDQLGLKGAGAKLKRFGRLFSAGFYGFIGVAGFQILVSVKNNSTISSELVAAMFRHKAGKAALSILGLIFMVVALVYFIYTFRPAKFRRELDSARMPRTLFVVSVWIARIGAIGRSMFFAAFGSVLLVAVARAHGKTTGDNEILGLEAVLTHIAAFNYTLLFVIGSLLTVYAIWCLILCAFRRLPAHPSENAALNVVGSRWQGWRFWRRFRHRADADLPAQLETPPPSPGNEAMEGDSPIKIEVLNLGEVDQDEVMKEEDGIAEGDIPYNIDADRNVREEGKPTS